MRETRRPKTTQAQAHRARLVEGERSASSTMRKQPLHQQGGATA
jgi:hypothetical protein